MGFQHEDRRPCRNWLRKFVEVFVIWSSTLPRRSTRKVDGLLWIHPRLCGQIHLRPIQRKAIKAVLYSANSMVFIQNQQKKCLINTKAVYTCLIANTELKKRVYVLGNLWLVPGEDLRKNLLSRFVRVGSIPPASLRSRCTAWGKDLTPGVFADPHKKLWKFLRVLLSPIWNTFARIGKILHTNESMSIIPFSRSEILLDCLSFPFLVFFLNTVKTASRGVLFVAH